MASRKDQRPWTADEDATLADMYPSHAASDVALAIGRTRQAVKNRVAKLGLQKNDCRTWFQAGQTPWNKGIRYEAGGRSVQTRFQPGQRPHTWNPIGHTRTTKDGYLQRKLQDTGVTHRDYVPVHHLVWRMHGRTVPPGHVIAFRDGNPLNVDINNLELISRLELMARNSVHRYPEPIARAVQLRGALIRQINKHNSKDKHS
jgi:hypothetical protein